MYKIDKVALVNCEIKLWWKGACGHEWQTSVKARSNGEKCPICSGARVIASINDLATLEPLLVKQWLKNLQKGIHETTEYLEAFLRNLLLNEKNELHNRNLHISGLLNEEKVDIFLMKEVCQTICTNLK